MQVMSEDVPAAGLARVGPGLGLLRLDEAVADGLGRGQGPAATRVLADLVRLAPGDLGQPEVEGVEHAGHLLLTGSDRGDGPEPRSEFSGPGAAGAAGHGP